MKSKQYLVLVLFIIGIVLISGCIERPITNEKYCRVDTDCACGVHITKGGCFYGNKNYVDTSDQCPDFCTGFAGDLRIKCVSNECKQVSAEEDVVYTCDKYCIQQGYTSGICRGTALVPDVESCEEGEVNVGNSLSEDSVITDCPEKTPPPVGGQYGCCCST